GVRMEHVLRNSLYALLERDGSHLPDILRLYTDDDFRKEIVRGIKNETVRDFWRYEFENYPARLKADACAPIQNKLGALLSDPTLYRILVEPQIDLHFRSIMDEGRVLLVNLSKGRLGEDSALLLGSLIVSTLGLAAFSRADEPTSSRRPFFVYVDEFQSFTTLMLANMMSELRKYGVGLVLAHQYIHQLEPENRHAVLGNAGTLISFRVGAEDASYLAKEFQPKFDTEDLINLPNRSIYLKLMIDGTPSRPFSAECLPLFEGSLTGF
ncbi:MAG: type IV secretion system DNA-binding domain-containing protein, partial [Acidobacteria bacterium]|nr:type IV secretion system DNA-binding domain-containing protein [Acidobacteriota bacterium]